MKVAVAPILLGLAGLTCAQSQAGNGPANDPAKAKTKPNFIFIITDDQDLRLGSLEYQPMVQKHLADQGTTFSKHYCTISICCPSRVSLLTGRAAHNTNVTDVAMPYGGYPKFASEGWNDKYLPVWLQDAGYNTYYTGKLMNGFSTKTYNNPFPKGWTGTDFFVDPNTYVYYNVSMQRNKEEPRLLTGQYSTDLAANSALSFLDEALADGAPQKPFFLGVAPIGPHSETWQGRFSAPVPADRHKELFPGLKVPRNPNFNPEVPSGGGWIKTLDRQNQTAVDYHDGFYRKRIQALQAVDELVDSIVKRLETTPNVLANTYLIYTSDNGFHIGQHRLSPGKTCSIEEDINVPFVIRGPGIPAGGRWALPTSHTDIVPTLFELAGIPLQEEFDGVPMPVTETAQQQNEGADAARKSEHVNVEFWGMLLRRAITLARGPGLVAVRLVGVNGTYEALRLLGDGYDLSYTVWCTNEHELYDLKADPWQINNIYADSTNQTVYGRDKPNLIARVDALLLTLKACQGAVCRRPWESLHPAGDVHSLRDAMAPQFDDFYLRQQPRVAFSECKLGYLAEFEGTMQPSIYGAATAEGVGMLARWEDWT
ncbi:arylsulfatase precursor [Apiospora sp. TS-2023a]